jgi:hypothetical protein
MTSEQTEETRALKQQKQVAARPYPPFPPLIIRACLPYFVLSFFTVHAYHISCCDFPPEMPSGGFSQRG